MDHRAETGAAARPAEERVRVRTGRGLQEIPLSEIGPMVRIKRRADRDHDDRERSLRNLAGELSLSAAALSRLERGALPRGSTTVKLLRYLFGDDASLEAGPAGNAPPPDTLSLIRTVVNQAAELEPADRRAILNQAEQVISARRRIRELERRLEEEHR